MFLMPQTAVSTKSAIAFLFSYVKQHAAAIVTGMLLLVAVDMCQLLIPRLAEQYLHKKLDYYWHS